MAEEIHEFLAMIANTTKPLVMLSYSERAFELVYEMAAAVAGGWEELREKPFLLSYPEPITPLVFPKEVTYRIMRVAQWGLPQIFGPVAQLGATGPITMAGALAQIAAESLICLTLAQLTRAGAPCFMSANLATFDMKSGTISPAAPETNLGTPACAEIAQYFGLPSWGVAGATDAKVLDAQAGVESAFGIMAHALSGVSMVHDVGYMDGSMLCSPEMLVMGDEVIGMVERFARGIVVNEETLQRDLIASVCPGGNYLQEGHTAANFRKELWLPTLMTRERYDAWQARGGRDLRSRIRDKIRDILETHKAEPLSDSLTETLEEIKKTGERELEER
jgi:trimethylamine--corrinoid protein Co-methyltransferase